MELAVSLVVLVSVVLGVTAVTHRWKISAPLVLLLAGAALSWLPFVPEIRVDPEIVLLGLLPPLLYTAAIQTSAIDFRRNLRPIGFLSVLLVAVTALIVGVVAWLLLPVSFAVAFALGAVVAPPDAVAATAVARRVGLPRRVVNLLEGESLVNDATAITCLRIAIVAITGTVSALEVGGSFLLAAGGGIVVGLVTALVISKIRRRITNPLFDTALSLLIPFIAYLPAEAIHASGVIAVVVTGIVLGHRSPVIQTADSRVNERVNWRTIQFLLEHTVFLLIGLQTRWIITDLFHEVEQGAGLTMTQIVAASLVILATVIIVRMAWVLLGRTLVLRTAQMSWAESAVVGWAGMRGVVTLAVAFLLPEDTPYRPVVIFVALVVTAGTLLIQGLTLGPVAQRLGVRGPDAREDALHTAHILQKLGNRTVARLDDINADPEIKAQVVERVRVRSNSVWERLGQESDTPAEAYRRLRLETLAAERADLLALRSTTAKSGDQIDQDILAQVLSVIDVEEATLARINANLDPIEAEPLTTAHLDGCPELAAAATDTTPLSATCLDCEREQTRPVSLRMCLVCGNVGCCDSSVGRHATAHFRDTSHAVMRSIEPGEHWRWCYLHERLG